MPRRGFAIARTIAGDRHVPGQVDERGERGDQHVVALARHDGTDSKQPHDAVLASMGGGNPVGARACDCDAMGGHIVFGGE